MSQEATHGRQQSGTGERMMRVIERLRLLVESAPPDATVPVRWLGELLA